MGNNVLILTMKRACHTYCAHIHKHEMHLTLSIHKLCENQFRQYVGMMTLFIGKRRETTLYLLSKWQI